MAPLVRQPSIARSGAARARLIAAARRAARHSHSPYSSFRVGAAVLTPRGTFTGTNVENASYGLSLCAERAALAAAVAAGAGSVAAIAVSCIDADGTSAQELMPCGACRQWFAELAPDAVILVDGVDQIFSVADLLPAAFTLTTHDGRTRSRKTPIRSKRSAR